MSNKGKNPNSQKNLKPVKKGEVRNPKGKAPGTLNFSTYLKAALDTKIKRIDPISKKEEKKAIRAAIVAEHIALALEGDLPAIKELYDREIGKVPQKNEHDINPIPIVNLTGKDLEKVIKKMMEEDDC